MTGCHICNTPASFFLKTGTILEMFHMWACVRASSAAEKHLHEVYSEKAGYQKHRKKVATQESRHVRKMLSISKKFLAENFSTSAVQTATSCIHEERVLMCGVEVNSLTADVARARGLDVRRGLSTTLATRTIFDVVFLGISLSMSEIRASFSLNVEGAQGRRNACYLNAQSGFFLKRTTHKLYRWFKIPWSVLTPPHHLFSSLKAISNNFRT